MLMLWPVLFTVPCLGLEREVSPVTGEAMGELAAVDWLAINLHAKFMVSRIYGNETALNWYNCRYSGGSKHTEVGGNFGDFGLHVPAHERDDKYPNATTIGDVPAVTFGGNDIMKGNFAVEETAVGSEDGCALDRLVRTNELQLEPPEGSGPAESQWI